MSDKEPEKTKWTTWGVVMLNLIIFIAYNVLFNYLRPGDLIFGGFMFCVHAAICMLFYAITGKRSWVLAAGLVLVIGFATCTTFLNR